MLNPDNETLEWCAKWIEDSLSGETNERTIEFGKNMVMTIRAVKTRTPAPSEAAGSPSDAEREFLAASVAVWQEVDQLPGSLEGYRGLDASTELRKREREAWERYKGNTVASCSHLAERDALGNAIANAATKAGIITGDHPLDGPQLVTLCGDLANAAQPTPTTEVKQRAQAAAEEIGRLFGRPFDSDSKKIVAIIVRHLTGDQQGEKEDL